MINILSFLFLQSKRKILKQEQEKKLPFLILFLFLGAILIQIGFIAKTETWNSPLTGWILTGAFIVYTCFGLLSNRIPSQMEDVIWLYTAPYKLSEIIYAALVWKAIWKGLLWLCSGIASDLILLLWKQHYINLTGKAIGLVLLIIVMETWIMAVSCTRAVRSVKFIFTFFTLILSVFYCVTLYYSFINDRPPSFWRVAGDQVGEFGNILMHFYSPVEFIMLGLILISIVIIHFTSNKIESKEKLVKEAEFWAEFQDSNVGLGQDHFKEKQTWWGLKGLVGVFSFLWVEILLVKKNLFFHMSHFAFLLLLFPYLMSKYPDVFNLLFTLIVCATFFSSYYSGLVRHAKSGDLFLLPGSLWKKVLLLEVSNTIWLFVLLVVSVVARQIFDQSSVGEALLFIMYGIGGYIFLLTIRWVSFVQTRQKDPSISLTSYYKYFLINSAVSIFFLFIVFVIAQKAVVFIFPVILIGTGGWTWFLFYKYRRSTYFNYLCLGTFLFSILLSLIIGKLIN
ncbi:MULTISPECIES: sporulation killing factor system integral membrane protein [Bacillus]|uniref:sporulation killing factor system integral membrane protein n=1 Tax=Bacillus TaxID=1386 RepID=UPI0015833AB0|nr:sporulation killing factor system integral membrane protein [Bacillus glycinifermentans]MBU8785855.1 sporulation killing factor system integral membrane protein [Bacillus glycinifermentans]NUJ15609.1 sporulation killing factor system integral membrane protein [Bacillus glycinifermentans]